MARRLLEYGVMQRGWSVRARIARGRGFTLVELGAVVVIIGILAVVAIVGYRKYILSSKVSEAQNVIGAIKLAQEDFRAERGTYFGAAAGGGTWCPWGGPPVAGKKMQWNPNCWAALPTHVEQPVAFSYYTNGGIDPTQPFTAPPATPWVTGWGNTADRPWYVIKAEADLNPGNATLTELATSSGTNQVFVNNEGD